MWSLFLRGQVGGLCLTFTAKWAPHCEPQSQMQEKLHCSGGFLPTGAMLALGNLPGGEREEMGWAYQGLKLIELLSEPGNLRSREVAFPTN